jgi:hypothetical protein
MSIREQRPFAAPTYSSRLPEPTIPVRRMPPFMKVLWLLAVLLLVGVAYSFWRISNVANPKLELPAGAQPATSQPT